MSEEFKYGTAENMSKTNYLCQGVHLVASVYLLNKSLGKYFKEENVSYWISILLNIGQVLCHILLLLPLIVYILHDWSFLTCAVIFKLKFH